MGREGREGATGKAPSRAPRGIVKLEIRSFSTCFKAQFKAHGPGHLQMPFLKGQGSGVLPRLPLSCYLSVKSLLQVPSLKDSTSQHGARPFKQFALGCESDGNIYELKYLK